MKKLARLPLVALGMAIAVYAAVTLSAIFSRNHVLYNIEPYPDGLLYALSARNAVIGRGLQLSYNSDTTPLWVPPLYSWVLIPGYIVSIQPWMFYVTNTVLGIFTLFAIFFVTYKLTKSLWAGVVATGIYLSHAVVFWLPTVPMTENITVLLLTSGLLVFVETRSSKWTYLFSISSLVALTFTRYAVFPVTFSLLLLLAVRHFWKLPKKPLLSISLGIAAALVLLELLGIRLLSTFIYLVRVIFIQPQYYSFQFVLPNLVAYTNALLGLPGRFLWLTVPLTSAALVLPALWFGVKQMKTRTGSGKWPSAALIIAFVSQFALLLIFYTFDSRYAILTLPIISVLTGWGITTISTYKKNWVWGVACVLLLLHLFSQAVLFKEVVANNLLHRSVAWQYQSIQHFNSYFSSKQSQVNYLITALPPHLVDAYQTAPYRLLPLSDHQEFLQKGEHVWGTSYNYRDLAQGYRELLADGKQLYISNAYVTHQQVVIQDFEHLKTLFELQPVSEGCAGTCNIYQLKEK